MSNPKNSKPRDPKAEVSAFFEDMGLGGQKFSIPKNSYLLSTPHWWNDSRTEGFCLKRVAGEPRLLDLIDAFVSQRIDQATWNQRIIGHFLSIALEETLQKIRFKKAYFHPEVREAVRDWAAKNDSLSAMQILKQFDRLALVQPQLQKALKEAAEAFERYPWIDFLSLLAIWWEDSYAIRIFEKGDFPHVPPDMAEVASIAVRCKIQDKQSIPQWDDPIPLQERFIQVLDKCKDPSYWHPFKEIMQSLMMNFSLQQMVDSFSYQNHRIVEIAEDSFILIPESPERENRWIRIGEQLRLLQEYYNRVGMQMLGPEKTGHPLAVVPLNPGHQVRWRQLGIPQKIKFFDQEVETSRAVLFITALGEFHKGRYVEEFERAYPEALQKRDPFPARKAIEEGTFGTNLWLKPMMGPMNITTSRYMVDRVLGKVHFHQEMNAEELTKAVEFLALDMAKCSPNFEFDMLEYPFLQFGKVIFYLTNAIVPTDSSVVFQNRLFAEAAWRRKKGDGNLVKQISDNFEEIILKLCRFAGFSASKGVKLFEDGREIGEIDVLAWRGNEALVIQAKNTYFRSDLKKIGEHYHTLEEAGRQIDVCIDFIQENTSSFLETNGIAIVPEDLRLFGLVISATQEGNYEQYGQGQWSKISLPEFQILITNGKRELFDWDFEAIALDLGSRRVAEERYHKMSQGEYGGDPLVMIRAAQLRHRELIHRRIETDCHTWNHVEPSIATLISRIEEDWLWKELITVPERDLEFPPIDASDSEVNAYINFENGIHAFENRDFKTASISFENAARLNPSRVAYLRMWADSVADRGLPQEAITIYNQLIERFPNFVEGYLNRGATYVQLGEMEKALEDYKTALELDPENKDALFSKFNLEASMSPESIEMKDWLRIQKIDPTDRRVMWPHILKFKRQIHEIEQNKTKSLEDFMKLSEANFFLGDHQKALIYLNKVIDQDQNHIEALYSRGWFKVNRDMDQAALDDFQRVIEVNPNHADAWDQAGSCLLALKRYSEARIAYETAVTLNPELLRAWYNFGVLFEEIGKLDEAIECFEKAIGDFENGTKALKYIGSIYKYQGKLDLAKAAFHQAVMAGDDEAYRGWAEIEAKKAEIESR